MYGMGARASKFCTMVTNTCMSSVFNLLVSLFWHLEFMWLIDFLKNLCISGLGHIAHLGARSDCSQHKVIHLYKNTCF